MPTNDLDVSRSEGELDIRLPDDRTGFSPSERIEVEARWWLPEAAETIELRLVWYTSGRGDQDLEIVEVIPLVGASEATPRQGFGEGQQGRRTVQIELPGQPYSFSGKLITLSWAIELVADEGRVSTRRDIVVAPRGREIALPVIEPSEDSARGPFS